MNQVFSRQNHLYPAMLGLEVFLAGDCNTYIPNPNPSICILYNRCTICNNGPVYEIKQPIHCAKVKLPPEYQWGISNINCQCIWIHCSSLTNCHPNFCIVTGCWWCCAHWLDVGTDWWVGPIPGFICLESWTVAVLNNNFSNMPPVQ